jgi:capsular polysaccharide transport system permease protein
MTSTAENTQPPASGKVLTLSNTSTPGNRSQTQKPRLSKLLWSFVLCVLLPIIAATAYYMTIATDRYAARAGFSIRGVDTSAGIDGIGAITGLASSGSTTSDSYIVLSYLASRELVEAVDAELDLRGAYSATDVDPLSRLEPDANAEEFVNYWQRRIRTQFDPTSGIIEFEVQSFTPEHAREIADAVLDLTQALVNDLSANARSDALRFAREEVELQEVRIHDALSAIRDFRASEQSVDPSASAALEIQLIASLESRLIDLNARISALRQTLDEDAPSMNALRRNAEALEAQITERRQAIGNNVFDDVGMSAVTQRLALYEELEVERSLVQQAYASALISLEQARRDADRQQRYLAIHLRPQAAQSAEYPRSLRNLLVLSFALVAAWGIGALITYSVRDHLT